MVDGNFGSFGEWADGLVTDINIDKLLVLVEAKPEIYDTSRKDHNNQDLIAKAWQFIGREMNVPAADCKAKWYTLRSSYSRYLREVKKIQNGNAGKKKKWHLADDMAFLLPFMGQKMKNVTYKLGGDVLVSLEGENEVVYEYKEEVGSNTECALSANLIATAGSRPTSDWEEDIYPRKKRAKTMAEVVAEPMAAYFKSLSHKTPREDHPMILYFKGLMPEIEKLSATSQRRFKMDILQKLNYYLDIEERVPDSSMLPSSATSVASDRYLSDDSAEEAYRRSR